MLRTASRLLPNSLYRSHLMICRSLVRNFSDGSPDADFTFKGHPLPACTDKHHLRIESRERYEEFLKSRTLKQRLFWAKLGLLGTGIGLIPVMGGLTGVSSCLGALGLILLSLDKRVNKHLRRIISTQTEERNMINIDIQK